MPSSTSHSATRFETLDLMRGVAALTVLLFHCSPPSFSLAAHGYLAVDLFFALSGFVVAAAYSPKLLATMRFKDFMAIRLKRLYPLIVMGALIGFAGYFRAYSLRDLILLLVFGLLLLPSPLGSEGEGYPAMGINPPSWSLFWELVINAIFARWAVRWSLRTLAIVLVLSGVALCAQAVSYGQTSQGFAWPNWWTGSVRVTFSFTLGVMLYRIRPLPNLQLPVLVIALLTLGILMMPMLGRWNGLYDIVCIIVAFPILLVAGINSHSSRLAGVSRTFGDASYPAYILQGGIYPHVKGLWDHISLPQPLVVVAIVMISFALFFGSLLVSRPYERLMKKILPTVQRVVLPAQAAP